jgi:hypothetical protein
MGRDRAARLQRARALGAAEGNQAPGPLTVQMLPLPRAAISETKACVTAKAAKYGSAMISCISCSGVSSMKSQRPIPALLTMTSGTMPRT